ncbi:hypothetical protein DY000_02039559 [Brassica cretica]|uniref:Uncharacterized protein n=1 Tax=Brassica cretica TaxID=69181 RepID=A0ABQ7B8K8_BRACR|nr:hypothetical protein DY000_02039559 [Brassica cretica]
MDGSILNVSKEDFAELFVMHGSDLFCQPKEESTIPPSIDKRPLSSIDGMVTPAKDSYNKAEVDELVEEIYRVIRTLDDFHSKRLDDIYYPFDKRDGYDSETTRFSSRTVTIDRQRGSTIDRRRPHSTMKQAGFREELKDISETTHARFGMQQRSIGNLQHMMHAREVARERLKNQWTRGDEAIRSFIGACGSAYQLFTLAEKKQEEAGLVNLVNTFKPVLNAPWKDQQATAEVLDPAIDSLSRRNDQSGRNGDGGGTRTTATVVDLETTAMVVDPEATATVVDLEATATVVDLEETATVVDVEATATVWMWKQRLRCW